MPASIPRGSTILVTGGAGFIGSSICHTLAEHDVRIRVFDNLSTGNLANLRDLEGRVEFVQGDLRDMDALAAVSQGVDFVLHQAALPSVPRSIEDPVATHAANATGTLNVLVAARMSGVKRVVYASSSSVYGNTQQSPKREDMTPVPLSPYAASKLAGEYYCRSFHAAYGLETVVLRYFNVFGPRQDPQSQYAAVIPRFVSSLLNGHGPVVYGDGEQTRDFTFVTNVVEANLLALTAPDAPGQVLNIGCQQATSVNELLQAIREVLGRQAPARHAPPRPGEVRHSLADISRARSVLGYEPKVALREGLERTIRHMAATDEWRRGVGRCI